MYAKDLFFARIVILNDANDKFPVKLSRQTQKTQNKMQARGKVRKWDGAGENCFLKGGPFAEIKEV